MANISINDKMYLPKNKPFVENVFRAIDEACQRLGGAKDLIEVVKIAPSEPVHSDSGKLFMLLKLVISVDSPDDLAGPSRIEKESQFYFGQDDKAQLFLAQKIIGLFKMACTDHAEQLERRAQALRAARDDFYKSEIAHGNDKRCPVCGHMPLPEEIGKPCLECAKCSAR